MTGPASTVHLLPLAATTHLLCLACGHREDLQPWGDDDDYTPRVGDEPDLCEACDADDTLFVAAVNEDNGSEPEWRECAA